MNREFIVDNGINMLHKSYKLKQFNVGFGGKMRIRIPKKGILVAFGFFFCCQWILLASENKYKIDKSKWVDHGCAKYLGSQDVKDISISPSSVPNTLEDGYPPQTILQEFVNNEYATESGLKEVYSLFKKIGDGRRAFWNMLARYVGPAGYRIPNGNSTVLVLGCGKAEEACVLSAFFSNSAFGSPSSKVKVIGIDLDAEEIRSATKSYEELDYRLPLNGQTPKMLDNYEFIVGDATNLDQLPSVPMQVDVVVARHQNISASIPIWRQIFSEGLKRLRPGGIFILTSYSEIEAEILKENLIALKSNIIFHSKNPFSIPLNELLGVSRDRVVTILKK